MPSMLVDLWTRTSGTWINLATVLAGTGVGLTLRGRLPQRMQQVIIQGVGLLTLFLGLTMAGRLNEVKAGPIEGIIVALLAMVIGGLLGEWWQIEQRLEAIGHWLKRRFQGGGRFTEGFVAASLLFCIGPMTLIGSLTNGLTGDNTLLTLKATMDGLAAIALTSSFGIGVGYSCFTILIYQGGLSLGASLFSELLSDPSSNPHVLLITGVGGLIILGIGLNLLEMTQIRVASFLPALLVVSLLYGGLNWSFG